MVERILTEAEEDILLEACSDTLRPIIVVALNTGMRRAEILNLKWNQIDFEDRKIRVEKTKSGKVRFVPVNNNLFYVLKSLRAESGQSPFVFLSPKTGKPYLDMKTGFKGACKRAGISDLRFHDLRHTFASRLVEKNVDIETVKELLGHHSITITQRYTHSSDDRKKAAVELLNRKNEDKICDVSVTQENQSRLIH
jgi:integrase